MYADFLSPSDGRWKEALNTAAHDVYDLPEYVAVCGKQENAAPVAFYASEGTRCCLIPLLQRSLAPQFDVPAAWSDAVSPYGYSSVLCTGSGEWAERALRTFARACADRDIVSVLVRVHPLLPVPEAAMDGVGVRKNHGETVPVDLTRDWEYLRLEMRRDHRHGISHLRRDGFTVSVDNWPLYGRFIEIYRQTMEYVGADPFYHFPASYFHQLREALGPHLHLFSVLAPNGETAAAGLFMEAAGIVQWHLSGTLWEYRHVAPSKLIVEGAIAWAKARGNRVLHLGGGVGAHADSLFQFKAGFSKLRLRFQTWCVVCDDSRYSEMVRAAHPAVQGEEEYFPAYRGGA
jgi:hypothetical protein